MLMMAAVLNPQAAPLSCHLLQPPPSPLPHPHHHHPQQNPSQLPGREHERSFDAQLKAEIDPQTLLDIYVFIVPVDGEESHLESIRKSMTNQTRINIRNSN